ncbi:hypothetical protein [Sphingomonas sanxanigenens]|uniref:hypothetical protein n=1 Tax=Sphingomonas sanxanigenens TaxID=397260 RepID=UPI0013012FFB|nr:hypothetical protein [Sphingomonas sanxanigenens]
MSFVDRFADVVDFMLRVRERESQISLIGHSLRLHMSEDILEHIHTSNPSLNKPPRPHYFNQYKSIVLPELMRRATICSDESCPPIDTSVAQAIPTDDQSLTDLLFADHLNMCLSCSKNDSKCVLRGARCSIANDNHVFEFSAYLNDASIDALIDPIEVLPVGDEDNRLARLEQAIASFVAVSGLSDAQWRGRTIAKVEIGDEFWATYRQAQFHLNRVYAKRLCSVLSQVATGLNIDTNAHGMTPEKFTHGGKAIGKWNAYIFKMGPSAQDQRCSRLYYGFSGGSLVLYRYEPDAH